MDDSFNGWVVHSPPPAATDRCDDSLCAPIRPRHDLHPLPHKWVVCGTKLFLLLRFGFAVVLGGALVGRRPGAPYFPPSHSSFNVHAECSPPSWWLSSWGWYCHCRLVPFSRVFVGVVFVVVLVPVPVVLSDANRSDPAPSRAVLEFWRAKR